VTNIKFAANIAARKEATEFADLAGKQSLRFWECLALIASERAGLPRAASDLAGKSKPVAVSNVPPPRANVASYDEAIELCDEIESLADAVPERGEEFADSVRTRADDIRESVEQMKRATEGQITALENMRDGLARWIR